MKPLKRFLLICCVMLFAVGVVPGIQDSAFACPSCKNANEADSRRPRAYMYSILFMLAMPATVFTGFGVSFYRLTRQARLAAEQQAADEALVSGLPSDGNFSDPPQNPGPDLPQREI